MLCPALGYEYMSAFRTWRVLAGRLAALGFDTLRFDYDGTGNSAGDPEEPDRVAAWLRSIELAIAEIRRLSGAGPLALVGLRAGGMLALQAAAAAGGVDRLVLWNLPSFGPRLREGAQGHRAPQRARRRAEGDGETESAAINAEGYMISLETAGELERWTLDSVVTRPRAESAARRS